MAARRNKRQAQKSMPEKPEPEDNRSLWLRLPALIVEVPMLVFNPLVWTRLWRLVEISGDVDFLATLAMRWPAVIDFIANWGWLIVWLVGALWLLAYSILYQTRRFPKVTFTKVAMALFFSVCVVSAFSIGRYFPALGSLREIAKPMRLMTFNKQTAAIRTELHLSQFKRYADDYKVMISCRVTDRRTDFRSDDTKFHSDTFDITDNVVIETQISKETLVRACRLRTGYECLPALVDIETDMAYYIAHGQGMGVWGSFDCEGLLNSLGRDKLEPENQRAQQASP